MPFKTEKSLFNKALASSHMETLFNRSNWLANFSELSGLFGIPDLIVAIRNPFRKSTDSLMFLAFEMKLRNWKRALVQAFRYRCFAHKSYVLLDRAHVDPARKQIEMFQKSNVGLLSIDTNGEIKIHCKPRYRKPYSQDLESALRLKVTNGGHI
ncbi:hypothetical protein CEE36_03475 [candidate division TA06 bacterium B3_TA06]|uniref:Uncharacterized protein n=1 Tax=candidate division TA06 bacterium B3_TA06 TaxID=2012487 RepID=A0A532V969_UNCT6|nr:MAG: hypothetical protein CEE36_03475 [candidate division TA06 bacterium B3_TA06]